MWLAGYALQNLHVIYAAVTAIRFRYFCGLPARANVQAYMAVVADGANRENKRVYYKMDLIF